MFLCALCSTSLPGNVQDCALIDKRRRALVRSLLKLADVKGWNSAKESMYLCKICESDVQGIETLLLRICEGQCNRLQDASFQHPVSSGSLCNYNETLTSSSPSFEPMGHTSPGICPNITQPLYGSRIRRPPKRYRDEQIDADKSNVKTIYISSAKNKLLTSSFSTYPKMAQVHDSNGTSVGDLVEVPRNKNQPRLRILCRQCPEAFSQQRRYSQHLIQHVQEKEDRTLLNETPIKLAYLCTRCGRNFQDHFAVRRHFKTSHNEDRPFQCTMCTSTFKYKTNLDYHKAKHLNRKNYECPQCQKKFVLRYELLIHLRIHTGDKPFKCQLRFVIRPLHIARICKSIGKPIGHIQKKWTKFHRTNKSYKSPENTEMPNSQEESHNTNQKLIVGDKEKSLSPITHQEAETYMMPLKAYNAQSTILHKIEEPSQSLATSMLNGDLLGYSKRNTCRDVSLSNGSPKYHNKSFDTTEQTATIKPQNSILRVLPRNFRIIKIPKENSSGLKEIFASSNPAKVDAATKEDISHPDCDFSDMDKQIVPAYKYTNEACSTAKIVHKRKNSLNLKVISLKDTAVSKDNTEGSCYLKALNVMPGEAKSSLQLNLSQRSLLKKQMNLKSTEVLNVPAPSSKPVITNVEILPQLIFTNNSRTHMAQPLTPHEAKLYSEYKFQCSECCKYFKQKSVLTKHLRTHTGEKPYKCNLCPKSYADASNYKKHKMLHVKNVEALKITRLQTPISPAPSYVTDPDPDGIEVMQTIQPFELSSTAESDVDDDDDMESYILQDALQLSLMNRDMQENIRRNLRAIMPPAAKRILFTPKGFSTTES